MQSNEAFRLLNLSAESLSDLDLNADTFEVNFEKRKRKMRKKKSRSRTPVKVSSQHRSEAALRCSNLGLWTALVMCCGWLFIVSYILSVIHVEYRRLEVELQKACNGSNGGGTRSNGIGNGINSHDQLLSQSTDDQDEYYGIKVRSNARCHSRRINFLRTCGLFVFLTCMFLSLGFIYWLYFDIREQISDYRMRIEQVSATTQHVLPEALQKWHETSKYLEQNQTNIFQTLAALQDSMKAFNSEISKLQQRVEQKNENSQETQFKGLQENLAKLGSKIEDFSGRIEKLEQEYETLKTGQGTINFTVTGIEKKIQSAVPASTVIDNTTRQHLEEVSKQLNLQIQNLSNNITAETSELKAKYGFLKNDFTEQKNKTDSLLDQTMNISSHVSSIENLYTTKLSTQLLDLEGRTNNLSINLNQIQNQCIMHANQYDLLTRDIKDLRKQIVQTGNSNANTNLNNNNNNQQQQQQKPNAAVSSSANASGQPPASASMFQLPVSSSDGEVAASSSSNKSVISQNFIKNSSNSNNNDKSIDKSNNNGSSAKTTSNDDGNDGTLITM